MFHVNECLTKDHTSFKIASAICLFVFIWPIIFNALFYVCSQQGDIRPPSPQNNNNNNNPPTNKYARQQQQQIYLTTHILILLHWLWSDVIIFYSLMAALLALRWRPMERRLLLIRSWLLSIPKVFRAEFLQWSLHFDLTVKPMVEFTVELKKLILPWS